MSDSNNPAPPAVTDAKNFLGRELPYRSLYVAVASILVVCVVFALLLLPMVQGFSSWSDSSQERASRTPAPAATRPAGPLLQAKPEEQYVDYTRQIDRELETYRWIDREGGVAQIPLERARELVLSRGLAPAGVTETQAQPPSEPESAAE